MLRQRRTRSWQIQEAKQRFSEVCRLAGAEGPQRITYRGEPNVWVISDREYVKLNRPKENLVDFFQRSPHRMVDIVAPRKKDLPRKINL